MHATKGDAWCAGARAGMRFAVDLYGSRQPLVAWQEREPLRELLAGALAAVCRRLIRWGRR